MRFSGPIGADSGKFAYLCTVIPLIRHRRLYAFYKSKALNGCLILIITALSLQYFVDSQILVVLCAGTALLFFIGYSLWMWLRKPRRIVINKWLADISGWFVLYYLIVNGMSDAISGWWYVFPVVCAFIALSIALVRRCDDEVFEIG